MDWNAHSEAAVSGRVAITAIRRIADAWGLSSAEMAAILAVDEPALRAFYEAQNPASVSESVLERVANLVLIWEDLAALFGRGSIAHEWVRRPNRDFDDRSPLQFMSSGSFDDLLHVKQYLSIAREI